MKQEALQRFPHLFDPNLVRRRWLEGSGGEVWIPGGNDEDDPLHSDDNAEPIEPVKRARQRKPSITGVSRQATSPLAPRLICREDAAAYVGVSPNTFDRMVADGSMPHPTAADGAPPCVGRAATRCGN